MSVEDDLKKIDLQGRFRLWFDYELGHFLFASRWGNGHSQKRTLTEDQTEVLKNILMGGHIKTDDNS